MKFSMILLIFVSVPAMANQAAEKDAIRKIEKRIAAAWNAHDAKAICADLDEDVETWDGRIKGKAALEKVYEDVFARRYKNFHGRLLDEIGIVFVTPKVAIYKARYETSGRLDEAGEALPAEKILYARIYVKRNGKWLGAHRGFIRPITE